MKWNYKAYFSKKTASARLDLRIDFESYSEAGEKVTEGFVDDIDDKLPLFSNNHYGFNYLNWIGNFIDNDAPFEYLRNLYFASNELLTRNFEYQLENAISDFTEYIRHNDFSKDFLEVFANSKRINLHRIMLDGKYRPLSIDNKTDDVLYCYESKDIKDVIFANIQFALENGYKLVRCKHCGKWFFAKTLKEVYCTRKSPYPEYERYTCKEAVKKIKDKLEKKRISEYERLRLKANEYGVNSNHYTIWLDFCNKCTDYKERLKNNSSIELLQEYERYLFDSKNVRKKYERIKVN